LFFFQAEDGIRDDLVTGVQTCALPIYDADRLRAVLREGNLLEENRSEPVGVIRADTAYVITNLLRGVLTPRGTGARAADMAAMRSEERRAGNEGQCQSRQFEDADKWVP